MTKHDKVTITINEQKLDVPSDFTILEAARMADIKIPTLCHLDLHNYKLVNQTASCRVCMVELKNRNTLVPSCVTKVTEGMEISTDSLRAIRSRRMAVELLLSNHTNDCFTCAKNLECELQALAKQLGIREIKWKGESTKYEKDTSSDVIVKDPNKCIMCKRCETVCNKVQTCGILSTIGRGFGALVGPAFNIPLAESSCTYCGQCVAVCPTGALREVNHTGKVWRELNDPKKYVVVQTAPAIRVTLGELFGLEPGTDVTGQMVTALKRMGFESVFDTDFAADLTIMEEATEFLDGIENGGRLPMLTSCCPAWVKFIEHQFPELLDVPSSCKSPQIMMGSVIKSYYAEKVGVKPDDIVVVSVMPCIAKIAEAKRQEFTKDEARNVDIVITTRELGAMIKEAGIDFVKLPESKFDYPLGESTGAAVIFGSTGGVSEAVVRTAYEWITGEMLDRIEFTQLRGIEGIRSATVRIKDKELKIGIAHELGNARKILEDIRDNKCHYDIIEIMACPGGCIGGGGQPYHHGNEEILKKRQEAIYNADRNKKIRASHENPAVVKLYNEYLGKPNQGKAHELLHTYYEAKEKI